MCCCSGHLTLVGILRSEWGNGKSTGLRGIDDGNGFVDLEQGLLSIPLLLAVLGRFIVLQILLWQGLVMETELELTFSSGSRQFLSRFGSEKSRLWCIKMRLCCPWSHWLDYQMVVWTVGGFNGIEFVLVVVNSTRNKRIIRVTPADRNKSWCKGFCFCFWCILLLIDN